jgi:signal transduction histidine kinase
VNKIRPALLAGVRGFWLAVSGFSGAIPLLVLSLVSIGLMPIGVGFLGVPVFTRALRGLANYHRRTAADWFGVDIAVPYRPWPGHLAYWQQAPTLLKDPATWRDLLWCLLAPVFFAWGLLPMAMLVNGFEGVVLVPALSPFMDSYRYIGSFWLPGPAAVMSPLAVVEGALLITLALIYSPRLMHWRAEFARTFLGPTRAAALTLRVEHLTVTRSAAVDAQASELRRIERDLHDGAQARLVAVGLSIGLAEELIRTNPEAAQQLLTEARLASDEALDELRSLVRGIHPPVLAERGLDGAIRAVALTLPLPVDVDIELPGRAPEPVETAAYFAVAEALANVVKHSKARRAWVRLRHIKGQLRIVVGDDGVGGADPSRGSGLRGVQRRLSAHDGTLDAASPRGGPTVLTMEVPCALSSPKTSPSSATG